MKKYMKPAIEVVEIEGMKPTALNLVNSADDSTVYTKGERNDSSWDTSDSFWE